MVAIILLLLSGVGPAFSAAAVDGSAGTTRSAVRTSLVLEPPQSVTVPAKAYQPHYLMGNNLSEIWDYRLSFPNGYLLNCRFMITSFGPGERTGLVLLYILPPKGNTVVIKNSRKWRDWKDQTTSGGPQFTIAKNSLRVDLPNHRLHIENEKGTLDLELMNTVEPFNPGRILYSPQDWYDLTLVAPRLKASGSLELPNQEPVALENGRGTATHIVSNIPDNRQTVSVFRFDSFDASTEFSVYELTTTETHRFQRIGFLTTFQNDRIAIHSKDFTRKFPDLVPDSNYKDYLVPRSFTLDHTGELKTLQGRARAQPGALPESQ
jgi:hypothetical protein